MNPSSCLLKIYTVIYSHDGHSEWENIMAKSAKDAKKRFLDKVSRNGDLVCIEDVYRGSVLTLA